MYKGNNPALNSKALENVNIAGVLQPTTVGGVVNKTLVLLGIATVSALIAINAVLNHIITASNLMPVTAVSFIVAFILAMITIFKPDKAKVLAPFYALSEGIGLGLVSLVFESMFPGIALQAIALTFLCLFAMLGLYRIGLIKATEKFRSTIIMATVAIAVLYLINLLGVFIPFLSFLKIPMISGSSMLGIGFSALVCIIASLSLIIDFDNIENACKNLLPKDYEWYFGFGLMITLVWLYIELLRLLSKLKDR